MGCMKLVQHQSDAVRKEACRNLKSKRYRRLQAQEIHIPELVAPPRSVPGTASVERAPGITGYGCEILLWAMASDHRQIRPRFEELFGCLGPRMAELPTRAAAECLRRLSSELLPSRCLRSCVSVRRALTTSAVVVVVRSEVSQLRAV